MYCSHCGSLNIDTDRVCVSCGKELLSAPAVAAPPSVAPPTAAPISPMPPVPPMPPSAGPLPDELPQTSGKAIASLVLGLFSLCLPAAIAAVILGHVSLSEIKKSAGRLKGDGLAIAGLVLGYMGVAFIPFILIVAAIAIPNLLRARGAANEAAAVSSIRAIVSAESTYASRFPSIGYTCDLAQLGGSGGGSNGAGLIDNFLASGTKSGYRVVLTNCEGSPSAHFGVFAYPVKPKVTGTRSFCADDSGVIRYDLTGSVEKCAESGAPLQ